VQEGRQLEIYRKIIEATQALTDQMKPKPPIEPKRPIAQPEAPKETHEIDMGTTLPTIPEEQKENKMKGEADSVLAEKCFEPLDAILKSLWS